MSENEETRSRETCSAGFSYIEVLIASILLMFSLLAMCSMFVSGYAHVTSAGRTTMGLAGARQVMEDMRLLPFDDLVTLDGFDTDDTTTLPAADPAREIARRWRYALAGDGVGWNFTSTEISRWSDLSDQGDPLGAAGTIRVVQRSTSLREITLTIAVPGRWRTIQISTLITRL